MTTGEAQIKITGAQMLGEEQDVTVMEAKGIYTETKDGCVIEYIEKPAKDMEVRNRIEVSSKGTIISKSGAVESKMIFTPGEENSMAYKTPFGVIDMTISCDEVIFDEEDCCGEIKITYDLQSGEQLVAHCSTRIEIELI